MTANSPAKDVWQQIHEIVEALLRQPTHDEFVAALGQGKQWVQFPPELRLKLKRLSDTHWDSIEPAVPDRCTYKIDIRRKVWWESILTGVIGDENLVDKLLWWFMPSVWCASSYMQALATIPEASRKPLSRGPQHELTSFFGYALARLEGMQELFWVSEPCSTVRYYYFEDMFPRYVKDVRDSRLNRAISEARRNGELAVLAPRLEALEIGLKTYADVFIEHPKGNSMPIEPTPLNKALNDLLPYLDSGDQVAPTPSLPEEKGEPGLVLDDASYIAKWNGRRLAINSGTDFALLNALVQAKGALVPYGKLLAAVKPGASHFGKEAPPELKYAASRLRKAFEEVGCPYLIDNASKKGYQLVLPDD